MWWLRGKDRVGERKKKEEYGKKRERHGRVRNIYMRWIQSSLPQVGNWARGREVQQCPQHFQQQLRCNIDRSMATRHTEDKKQPLFQKHIHSHFTVRHAGGMRRKHRRYDWDLRDFFLINVTASQNNTLCTSVCTQRMFLMTFVHHWLKDRLHVYFYLPFQILFKCKKYFLF